MASEQQPRPLTDEELAGIRTLLATTWGERLGPEYDAYSAAVGDGLKDAAETLLAEVTRLRAREAYLSQAFLDMTRQRDALLNAQHE